MDLRKIKTLIGLFEQSSLTELEMSTEEEQIRLARGSVAAPAVVTAPVPAPTAVDNLQNPAQEQNLTHEPQAEADVDLSNAITSPLVGSFYRQSSPGEKPFVEVGQAVNVGDTLCIIEAMKIMNPVKAEKPGTVKKILVSDASPVEYGQPLMVIE